jgi:hypothetical protein
VKGLVAAYRDLVRDIRDVVGRVVPAGGDVMVVSKGDGNLLQFDGRPAATFRRPRPASTPVITRETAPPRSRRSTRPIERGHQYLLFPGTSLWWLDHYDGFRPLSTRAIRGCGRTGSACSTTCASPAPRRCQVSTVLVASVIATKCRNGGNARAV